MVQASSNKTTWCKARGLLWRARDFRMQSPRALSYRNSRLLCYVAVRYIEPRIHYLGNWSPSEVLGNVELYLSNSFWHEPERETCSGLST